MMMKRAEVVRETAKASKGKTASSPASDQSDTVQSSPPWIARMMLQGWAGIAFWMAIGLLLEGLLGYKIPSYLDDSQRRELFRLAHAHGTLLSLVLVAAALYGQRGSMPPPRAARFALRLGAVLMPVGFLLAGVWHPEGDPGPAIWLVPVGALMVIFGAIAMALACRIKSRSSD